MIPLVLDHNVVGRMVEPCYDIRTLRNCFPKEEDLEIFGYHEGSTYPLQSSTDLRHFLQYSSRDQHIQAFHSINKRKQVMLDNALRDLKLDTSALETSLHVADELTRLHFERNEILKMQSLLGASQVAARPTYGPWIGEGKLPSRFTEPPPRTPCMHDINPFSVGRMVTFSLRAVDMGDEVVFLLWRENAPGISAIMITVEAFGKKCITAKWDLDSFDRLETRIRPISKRPIRSRSYNYEKGANKAEEEDEDEYKRRQRELMDLRIRSEFSLFPYTGEKPRRLAPEINDGNRPTSNYMITIHHVWKKLVPVKS